MILRRAFVREVLLTSVAVTVAMLMIFIVVRALGFLRQAAEGMIPVGSIFLLLLLKVMTYMDAILPLMVFIAILMVLDRWSRDNETIIMAASGYSPGYLLKPAAFLLVVSGVLVGGFSFYLSPLAVRVGGAIEHEFRTGQEVSGIMAGVFTETRNGRGVYFVERADNNLSTYENVFVYGSDGSQDGVVVAATARQEQDSKSGDRFLVLENGVRYEGVQGDPAYRVIEFESYSIRLLPDLVPEPQTPLRGWKNMSLLRGYDSLRPEIKISLGKGWSELQWRLSKVVVLPVLILFALGLGQISPSRGRLPAIIGALVIYFCYTTVAGFAVGIMRQSTALTPTISLWTLHLVFAGAAIYVFWCKTVNRSPLSLNRTPARS